MCHIIVISQAAYAAEINQNCAAVNHGSGTSETLGLMFDFSLYGISHIYHMCDHVLGLF